MASKYGKTAQEKVGKAMHELKEGTLKSGSGRKVTSRKQAIAIGLSEARERGAKVPDQSDTGKSSVKKKSPAKKATGSKKAGAAKKTATKKTAAQQKSPARKAASKKSAPRKSAERKTTARKSKA